MVQHACGEPRADGCNFGIVDRLVVASDPARLRCTGAHHDDVLTVARADAFGDLDPATGVNGRCRDDRKVAVVVHSLLGAAAAAATNQNRQ